MAIIKVHPGYPTLPIIVAQSTGDKPQPGTFFVTHKDVVLTDIAVRAYPSESVSLLTKVKRINTSKYNMAKCVYRLTSNNCYSLKVDGLLALSNVAYNPGAWLSLCNVDRGGVDGLGLLLNTPYQVMWIPPPDGREPWDLVPPTEEEAPQPPADPKLPNVKLPDILGGGSPTINVEAPDIDIDIGIGKGSEAVTPGPSTGGEPVPTPSPETQKAGVPWWLALVLGGGALVTVIAFAVRDRKKRGKKKGKK